MASTRADVRKVMQRKLEELRGLSGTVAPSLIRVFIEKLRTARDGDAALGEIAAALMLTAARSVTEELLALWAVDLALAERESV